MKQILNNPKSLGQLFNLMMLSEPYYNDFHFGQWLWQVSYDARSGITLKEAHELVKTKQVVRAAEFTRLPMYYLRATSSGMKQDRNGKFYKAA